MPGTEQADEPRQHTKPPDGRTRPPRLSPSERRHRERVTAVFVALIVALTLLNVLLPVGPPSAAIPYSQFLALVDQGRVKSVAISSTQVTGVYQAPGEQPFEATRPPLADDTTLVPLLERKGVQFTGSQPSPLSGFLTNFVLAWLLPFLFFAGLWALAFRRLGPGRGR